MLADERNRWWRWGLTLLSLGNLGNALWMLADPAGWYRDLPAAVPDTGPFNQHFVRDIGSAFFVMSVALLWAAWRPRLRAPMVAIVTLFYGLHALVHFADTIADRLPVSHWLIDAPGVYAPAVLLLVLTMVAFRQEGGRT